MKNSSLLRVAAAIALLPSFVRGSIEIIWSVAEVPPNGLTDTTFPISIANAPNRTGYYFAQQFNFIGQSDVGYTGLQSRPDSDRKPVVHAVFSSFVNGSTTIDGNCHNGADGGPCMNCSVEFSAPYANGFGLEIHNTQGTTWNGTVVVDGTTGEKVHIGSYTLPAGTKGIAKSQGVEYFPWNPGTYTCGSLPYTSVVFGVPTTSTNGAGSLSSANHYGDCVGKVPYESHRMAQRIPMQISWRNSAHL